MARKTFPGRTLVLGSRWSSTGALPEFNPSPSFRLTRSPNPGWDLGDGLPETPVAKDWKKDEEQGWKRWITEHVPGR